MSQQQGIPCGVYAMRVDYTQTLRQMNVGDVFAYDFDNCKYMRIRTVAHNLKKSGEGSWATSLTIVPGKLVITRLS